MKKRSRSEATLEITPLVDVIFLLLIFFMSSTVFKKDELSLLMGLPKSSEGITAGKEKKQSILIEVTKNEMALNSKKLDIHELSNKLEKITNKEQSIELRIDKSVVYERIIEVLEVVKKAGLTNLGLITEKK